VKLYRRDVEKTLKLIPLLLFVLFVYNSMPPACIHSIHIALGFLFTINCLFRGLFYNDFSVAGDMASNGRMMNSKGCERKRSWPD
jgi:hypothetical protein